MSDVPGSCSSLAGWHQLFFREVIPSHCVSDTGALGTMMRSSKAQMVQDQIHGQALPSCFWTTGSLPEMAPRMTFYLLPSRPQRPVLLTILVFTSRTSLMVVPCPPPLYSLLILFLFLHLANGRWGEASKGFPPDQRGSAWSFVRVPIVWDPGKNLSLPSPPSFLTRMPGRLLSWGPLTLVDALTHVFRRKYKVCLKFICSTIYLVRILIRKKKLNSPPLTYQSIMWQRQKN